MKRLIALIPFLFLLAACNAAAKPSTTPPATATRVIPATHTASPLLDTGTPSPINSTGNAPTVDSTRPIGTFTAAPSSTPTLSAVINVQNVSKLNIVRELDAHAGPVYQVAFSPQGDLLLSSGQDQILRAWDVHTGVLKYIIPLGQDAPYDFAFNPDGTRLFTGEDSTLSIWDTATGRRVSSQSIEGCCISNLEASPDGEYLAVVGYPKIELYDMKTLTHTRSTWAVPYGDRYGFLTFSADGSSFSLAQADPSSVVTLPVFDTGWSDSAPAGNIEFLIAGPPMRYVYGLAYSADNHLLWASDDGIWMSDLHTTDLENCNLLETGLDHDRGLAFSPDKKLLAAVNAAGELIFIGGQIYQPLVKFQLPHKLPMGIAFNAAGNLMAVSSSDDGSILLLGIGNQASGELPASPYFGVDPPISHGFPCLEYDIGYAASLTRTPGPVALIPTHTPARPAATRTAAPSVPTLTPTTTPGIADTLSRSGPWLLYTRTDKGGRQIIRLTNADGSGRKEIPLPANAHIENLNTALSPNGEWLAFYSGYAGDKNIDWNNQQDLLSHIKPPYDLALYLMHLPDGAVRRIGALLSPDYPANFDKAAKYILENDPEYQGYELKDVKGEIIEIFMGGIRELAWSPGGGYLAFASEADGPTSDLYVYDLGQGTIKRLTDGIGQIAGGLSWSPDNVWIVHTSSNSPVGEGWTPALYAARADGSQVVAFQEFGYGWGWEGPGIYMIYEAENGRGKFNLRNINLATGQSHPVWPNMFEDFAYDPFNDIAAVMSTGSLSQSDDIRGGLYLIDAQHGLSYVMPAFSRITFRGGTTDRFVLNGLSSPVIGISSEGITSTISTRSSAVSVSPSLQWMVLFNQDDHPGLDLYDENDVFIRQLATGPVNNLLWHPLSTAIFYTQGKKLYTVSIPDGNPVLVDDQLPGANTTVLWVP